MDMKIRMGNTLTAKSSTTDLRPAAASGGRPAHGRHSVRAAVLVAVGAAQNAVAGKTI
jgi:hypothetical protein